MAFFSSCQLTGSLVITLTLTTFVLLYCSPLERTQIASTSFIVYSSQWVPIAIFANGGGCDDERSPLSEKMKMAFD